MEKEEAVRLTLELNQYFKKPLSERQVNSIMASVDRAHNNVNDVACYIYTDKQIIDDLMMDSDEVKKYNLSEKVNHNEKRDKARKEEKQKRNDAIIDSYHKNISMNKIAELVNVSKNTVLTVIKAFEASLSLLEHDILIRVKKLVRKIKNGKFNTSEPESSSAKKASENSYKKKNTLRDSYAIANTTFRSIKKIVFKWRMNAGLIIQSNVPFLYEGG